MLLEFQSKTAYISLDIQRYLVHKIDLDNRLIGVKGARGAGKSTLLLQLAKFIYNDSQRYLIITIASSAPFTPNITKLSEI